MRLTLSSTKLLTAKIRYARDFGAEVSKMMMTSHLKTWLVMNLAKTARLRVFQTVSKNGWN